MWYSSYKPRLVSNQRKHIMKRRFQTPVSVPSICSSSPGAEAFSCQSGLGVWIIATAAIMQTIEDGAEINLESGTSLAEQEHNEEVAPRNLSAEAVNGSKQHSSTGSQQQAIEALRSEIAEDVLATGDSTFTFTSPFELPIGSKQLDGKYQLKSSENRYLQVPLIYCDQTASNRAVSSIEKYMQENCLPLHGNTHTNTSITGAQSTAFVAEARQIVAEETNARITGKASCDVVLFA